VKYLFVHQNFPGQYLHLVRRLVRQPGAEIVFVSRPNDNRIAGVRRVAYEVERPADGAHPHAREFNAAMARAEAVARACQQVKRLGFTPDIVIGHHGWGELLNVRDVWPDTPLLGYFEFFYQTAGADVGFDPEFPVASTDFPSVRAKNAVNLLALQLGGLGQTPTRWQQSTYPDWAQRRIKVIPEGVDLSVCSPSPAARRRTLELPGLPAITAGEKLVTYVARNLEPYRGFHVVMRALPALLRARPDVRVVLVGGDGVSYGAPPRGAASYRAALLTELGRAVDPDRVHFMGQIPHAQYLALLRRSDAHVYLTYPFVASWSLREAMACGCAIIGSATPPVAEFITDGRTGLLTPFHSAARLTERIEEVLGSPTLAEKLRRGARQYAERNLDLKQTHDAFEATLRTLTSAGPATARQHRPAA
jgi:glycosyltransferase involved in cell wall biosynthesis